MARLQINCDFGIFVTSSTGHLGSTKNCAPCSDHHVRTRAFININSDLYHDHGGITHGARGLNVNIALGRPCCFFGQLMTHKYRGSIVVLSISKSVEPNEEQKEMTSGFQ